jgi:hypothetical protein
MKLLLTLALLGATYKVGISLTIRKRPCEIKWVGDQATICGHDNIHVYVNQELKHILNNQCTAMTIQKDSFILLEPE